MDVMSLPVSRSGNYRPEYATAQAMFPDRECFVNFGQNLATITRTGNLRFIQHTKKTPNYTQAAAVWILWKITGRAGPAKSDTEISDSLAQSVTLGSDNAASSIALISP